MKLANPPGAQFEILVDGSQVFYRDIKAVAIASAEFLKSRNSHSEVAVKDLQSGGDYRRDQGCGMPMSPRRRPHGSRTRAWPCGPAANCGDSGLSPSYGIRHRSYDGSVFRLRGPSRLFIVPTMYIPTAIITTPRKATQHKSAKQASGIASANKTSRCMSCPSPPRPNNDRR